MTEILKKLTVTKDSNSQTSKSVSERKVSGRETTERLIYFFFGFIEVLLAFRLILKIAGANPFSGFVNSIYAITSIFTMPFSGIFRQGTAQGSYLIFEPGTLVALIVYSMIAWGLVAFLRATSGEEQAI